MTVRQIGQYAPDMIESGEFVVLCLVTSHQHIGGCAQVDQHGAQARRQFAKVRRKLDNLGIEIGLIDHRTTPA